LAVRCFILHDTVVVRACDVRWFGAPEMDEWGGAMRFENKVAIVTGGASGMGRAAAQALARHGAAVAVADLNEAMGAEVVEEIRRAGARAIFVKTDVSRPEQDRHLAEETVGELGGIDILVNCAGTWKLEPLEAVTDVSWDRQLDVNLKGTFFCVQAVVPHMLARGGGRIVNIASIAGLTGFSGAAVYCASKGGVVTLTKALALELAARGINVNCIAPGNIETPFNADVMADPRHYRAMIDATPAGRNGSPADIVPAILHLAGEESAYMHGSVMVIDGGWLAQ
jgi:NAD(P)-dependent dehydrogenase (short-subunit alcohol dehydrogenase family)